MVRVGGVAMSGWWPLGRHVQAPAMVPSSSSLSSAAHTGGAPARSELLLFPACGTTEDTAETSPPHRARESDDTCAHMLASPFSKSSAATLLAKLQLQKSMLAYMDWVREK